MGSSSGQVTGYKYHTSLILFIGNAIEKVLGINFDNRGWVNPLVDENSNALAVGNVNSPNIYGETEGGVAGQIHARYGSPTQLPVEFYSEYLAKNDIPPLAYQHQSYLAFEDFYVGNSGYMKEMLLWPKRTRKKSDGSEQWYQFRSDGAVVCEIGAYEKVIAYNYGGDTPFLAESKQVISDSRYVNNTKSSIIAYRGNGIYASDNAGSGVGLDEAFDSDFTLDAYWDIDVSHLSGIIELAFSIHQCGVEKSHEFICSEKAILLSSINSIDQEWYDGVLTRLINFRYLIDLGYAKKIAIKSQVSGLEKFKITHREFSSIGSIKLSGLMGDINLPTNEKNQDLNPIHKIREILTDRTAMNKPESEINEANFIKAANRIWDDGLGISWAIQEKSCIEAINELCFHIEAGIRINRQTGLYEMILFRDDWFSESEIHFLAENKTKNIEFEVQNGYEVVNQLNVNFYDRENIKNSSFCVAENASIKNLNGKVNAETIDFPYFMNQRNAEIVAKWKLRQFTSAGWKGSFTTSEKQARKWNRYDIVKINWSRKGIANLPVRILSLKFGGHASNTVTVEFEEVVKSLGNLDTTIIIDDGIDNTVKAPKPCNAKVFELPYFEAVQTNGERETNVELADNPEAGFVCAIAEKPQSNSLNAALYVNNGNGFEKAVTINYCETAYLEDSINKIASSFVVKNAGDLASVRVGSQIFINDEIMVYQSLDAQTKVLTVKRGALDTVPHNHNADSILYFADEFVAIDQTLYVSGEQVEAKALTTTPSGILSLENSETHAVELNSRLIRPYPPANVKINGEYSIQDIETDLVLTWVDRNRTQQTGGEILGWFDDGVTIESGVTYQLVLVERDENNIELRTQNLSLGTLNSYTFSIFEMDANTRTIGILLKTLREGCECLQPFEHVVELLQFFSAPYDLTVEFKND